MENNKLGMVLAALVLLLGIAFATSNSATSAARLAGEDSSNDAVALGAGCPANAIHVKCEAGSSDAARSWVGKDGCYYTCDDSVQCRSPAPVKCASELQYKYTDKNGCTAIGCRGAIAACPKTAIPTSCKEGKELYKYTKNGCDYVECREVAVCKDPAIPSCSNGELYKYTDPAGCTQVACRQLENEGVEVRLNSQSEVKMGDTFKVYATIAYTGSASADSAHRYKVVTHFDAYGRQNDPAQDPTVDRANYRQERVDYITLGSGESTEVSTYFNALLSGVHVVSVDVYGSSSDCDPRSMRAVACPEEVYSKLVSQAAAKVRVVGEELPPSEPSSVEGTIVLHSGWNMVSVPVMAKVSMARLASECNTLNYAWRYNVNYHQADTLEPGVGYWVYANSGDCKVPVSANAYTTELAPLKAGWNLIGAPGKSVAIADYSGNCKVTAGPWAYGTAASATISPYSYSGTLEPGMGYWVKVEESCKLGSTTGQPPQPPSG